MSEEYCPGRTTAIGELFKDKSSYVVIFVVA